jgi:hypothetical protein
VFHTNPPLGIELQVFHNPPLGIELQVFGSTSGCRVTGDSYQSTSGYRVTGVS